MLFRARDFAHQLVNVPLGITERGHPEIIAGHRSDQARPRKNFDTQRNEPLMSGIQIRDPEV
jgi:hypothetical protein